MELEEGSSAEGVFRNAEAKTVKIILNPAMGLAWILGLSLIWFDGTRRLGWDFLAQPWMIVKLAAVLFISGWHGFLAGSYKKFLAGERPKSAKFWRATNELPFLAAVVGLGLGQGSDRAVGVAHDQARYQRQSKRGSVRHFRAGAAPGHGPVPRRGVHRSSDLHQNVLR